MNNTRREFFADVGRGVLATTLGTGLTFDLGLGTIHAEEVDNRLNFGKDEALVAWLQETPPAKLQAALVEKLAKGTTLEDLVRAAALANARQFGGEDYIGFHTFMALHPALQMAAELPADRKALPVFKVLYRNANRTQETGSRNKEVLKPVTPVKDKNAEALRDTVRKADMKGADEIYAGLCGGATDDALNHLLPTLHDACEVHRVVLVSRAWDLVSLVGPERANTLLRQSVHYCVKAENPRNTSRYEGLRKLLPKLLDDHKLGDGQTKQRNGVDDAWIEKFSNSLFTSTPDQAATAAATALEEGISAEAIGEAIALMTNQMVLRDVGRLKQHASKEKPEGSVHGDSMGVHASDSANAWRNLAKASNPRNSAVCVIVGAYQAASDRQWGEFSKWEPRPTKETLAKLGTKSPEALLKETEGAIKENNQELACALVHLYGTKPVNARSMFDLLLRYAISEDGALHAEKYYRTVVEEYGRTREAFKWRQLTALARVTASAYGRPAPGYAEACRLLKVS